MIGRLAASWSRLLMAAPTSVFGLALIAGCGGAYEFETSTSRGGATTALAGGGGPLPPFLNLIETAKDTTAFRGIRREWSMREGDVLETREDVGADGSGEFAIELFETVSLPPDFEPTSFPIVYESAARFQWRMRDFRLRGLDRAALSYTINVLPATPTVAGVLCARVEFFRNAPIGGRPGHYEIDVDPRTGFVLAWREFDFTGQPIHESVYESFEYGGDVSDMNLRDRTFVSQVLNLSGDLGQQTGVNVRYPDMFPDGFEVVSGELMDVPATISVSPDGILQPGSWIRFLATDGIETITFAHADSQVTTAATEGKLKWLPMGAWVIGFGEIAGTNFAIAGRVAADDIRRIVQSAF